MRKKLINNHRRVFVVGMKAFLCSCVLLYCVFAFGNISHLEAHNFAVRFIEIRRSDQGIEKLKALVDDGKVINGQIGWNESVLWLPGANTKAGYDLRGLEVNQIFIREPDFGNPMEVQLTEYESAKCSIPPEIIVVIYLSNAQKDIRAVITMALFSKNGKIMLSPMTVEKPINKSPPPAEPSGKKIPLQKNLCGVPGVEIIKIADDHDSYGFPPPKGTEEEAKTFATVPLGCTLDQTILYAVDNGIWVKGLTNLPPGRFRIHCELETGENESVTNKLINAIANTFDLKIKMDDHHIWNGYQVSVPNPLPDCFRVTKNPIGEAAMHGEGDYAGYTLKRIISKAVHDRPFDFLSTNAAGRYDVQLELWPETYGEMAALKQLGFTFTQTNLQRRTLIISPR